LIDASRKTRKPLWPWLNFSTCVTQHSSAGNFLSFNGQLGTGLIPFISHASHRHELEQAIFAVIEVTAKLQTYRHNIGDHMVEMVQLRNYAQHLVLKLDPVPLFEPLVRSEEREDNLFRTESNQRPMHVPNFLYEVIRTSLLIFNNIVVYPLSPASGVETKLAKRLRVILYSGLQARVLDVALYTNLLLWSMILGGISTEDREDAKWFQTQCYGLTRNDCQWQSLDSAVKLLSSFIWLDFVMHKETKKFWTACQLDRQF
jgi:hypothetical protein